jgi:hypothetical protein
MQFTTFYFSHKSIAVITLAHLFSKSRYEMPTIVERITYFSNMERIKETMLLF